MSIISSVDLTLDAPYILVSFKQVSFKQRIEILLSRQYCIAFIVQGDAMWSMSCGPYNFVIGSNIDMSAMCDDANTTGVLLIAAVIWQVD